MRIQPIALTHTQAFTRTFLAVMVFSSYVSLARAEMEPVIEVGSFSTAALGQTLPEGWEPLTFQNIERYTVYILVEDLEEEKVVVRAVSEKGASGITRKMTVDLKQYPVIEWRWKVMNVLEKGDVTKKEGDDYPARIYIMFQYDSARVGIVDKAKYEAYRLWYGEYPPLRSINYIWESRAPIGTMVPNPYTDRVMMFVVQSGIERLDTWVTEGRNVYEDYKKAFGEEPPPISGVAIMTDTDNTGESATAYYGDILFSQSVTE